jgi:hypothetical protein
MDKEKKFITNKKDELAGDVAKFMKAKVSGLEESAKTEGMRSDRAFDNFRRPKKAKEEALKGSFSKNIKDKKYYKRFSKNQLKDIKEEFFKPESLKKKPLYAKGGRAGYKMGSKGCKLAMKGKGRAYGKNS